MAQRFACRPVDASFLDLAPWRFRNQVELATTPARAFALLEEADAWPRWFDGIRRVEWTSPRPFGVGTTRTVRLSTLTVDEHFFRWEPGRRFSFHFTATSLPLARALAEDYLLEPAGEGRARFTYTVALEPRLPLRLLGPLGRAPFARMFRRAAAGLQAYVAARP